MVKRCFVLLLCAAFSAPALAGGYGYGGYYGGGYKYHGGNDGDVLLAGLLIGGLVGYFIGEDRGYRRQTYTTYSYYGDPYDYYYRGGYRRDVYSREYVPASPPPQRVIIRESPQVAGHTCRMTREYTTTIEIDGRMRDAYGTKCLTADGSWVLGAPKLVPDFH